MHDEGPGQTAQVIQRQTERVEPRAISISLSARVSTPAPGTAEFLDCFKRRALFYCLAHIHDSIPQTIYLKQKLRGGLLDFCELQRHFTSYHITSHHILGLILVVLYFCGGLSLALFLRRIGITGRVCSVAQQGGTCAYDQYNSMPSLGSVKTLLLG